MSYTKLALSLLDNWMKQNNFVFKSNSIFTESLYYSKNNIDVRISAHLPCHISSELLQPVYFYHHILSLKQLTLF